VCVCVCEREREREREKERERERDVPFRIGDHFRSNPYRILSRTISI